MANVIVTVPTSNITVDTTNSIVNVASTSSNVVLSETAFVSNADVRVAISVSNESGFGNLAYDSSTTSNGIIQYTGVSTSDIRAQLSAIDAGGDGSLSYAPGTGAFTYTGPTPAESRAHISVNDTGGDGSLSYNSTNGIITYTGPSASEVRSHFSATAPVQYNSTTGDISIDSGAIFTGKTTDDLAQGTQNIYFSQSGATVNTTFLPEGTNLYFTDARARGALSATTPIYLDSSGVISLQDGDGLNVVNYGTTDKLQVDTGNGLEIAGIAGQNGAVQIDTSVVVDTSTDQLTIGGQKAFSDRVSFNSNVDVVRQLVTDGNLVVGVTTTLTDSARDGNVIFKDSSLNAGRSFTSEIDTVFKANVDIDSFVASVPSTFNSTGIDYVGNVITSENSLARPANLYMQSQTVRAPQLKTNYLFIGAEDATVSSNIFNSIDRKGALITAENVATSAGTPKFTISTVPIDDWITSNTDGITNAVAVGELVDTINDQTIGGAKVFSQNLTVQGNVDVQGNLNYVNVEDLNVREQIITLNVGNVAQSAFVAVDRVGSGAGTNVALQWNESTDRWSFTNDGTTYNNMLTSADIPADAVTSVNGEVGVVSLSTDNIAEGTNNKYFTTSGAAINTTALAEGTNLYYTDTRSRAAVSVTQASASGTGALAYNNSTGVFTYTPPDLQTDAEVRALLSTTTTAASGGGALAYDNTSGVFTFTPAADSGIALTDLSTTTVGASGGGSLAYNNSTGVFTFAPADLSTKIALTDLSTTTASASGGGSLAYNGTTGVFTFAPADLSAAITLTDLSATNGTASGGGSLAYDSGTGVFTYSPSIPGIALTDLSITSSTASGGGALVYNNSTGVFDYTPADISLATKTTTNLAEGTNLYFTTARARASVNGETASPSGTGSLVYDSASGMFTMTPPLVSPNNDEQIINGTSSVKIPVTDGGINFTVGNAPVGSFTTTGAAAPAEFSVEGNITAITNVQANVDVIALSNISASKNVQAVQTLSTTIGGVQAINGQSTVASYNNQIPLTNRETGVFAVQASDTAANVYSVPRYSSIKMPDVPASVDSGQFTSVNILDIGVPDGVFDEPASAMPPSSLVGVFDPKINKRRAYSLPAYIPISPVYGYVGEGATPHASGTILFDTDSSNTIVTSSESFGTISGTAAFTTAPVSQGIIKFRTLQPSLLPALPSQFCYTEANDFANSTVAYIDDKLRVGREDNSTSFSFPKTAGAVNQTLVLDGSRDLGFEDKGQTISYTTTEINALASPVTGHVVYNSTLAKLCFYNGSSWQQVTSTTM